MRASDLLWLRTNVCCSSILILLAGVPTSQTHANCTPPVHSFSRSNSSWVGIVAPESTWGHPQRGSTWGHPQPEVILPSLMPLVFERFFAYFNFVVVPKQSGLICGIVRRACQACSHCTLSTATGCTKTTPATTRQESFCFGDRVACGLLVFWPQFVLDQRRNRTDQTNLTCGVHLVA